MNVSLYMSECRLIDLSCSVFPGLSGPCVGVSASLVSMTPGGSSGDMWLSFDMAEAEKLAQVLAAVIEHHRSGRSSASLSMVR